MIIESFVQVDTDRDSKASILSNINKGSKAFKTKKTKNNTC